MFALLSTTYRYPFSFFLHPAMRLVGGGGGPRAAGAAPFCFCSRRLVCPTKLQVSRFFLHVRFLQIVAGPEEVTRVGHVAVLCCFWLPFRFAPCGVLFFFLKYRRPCTSGPRPRGMDCRKSTPPSSGATTIYNSSCSPPSVRYSSAFARRSAAWGRAGGGGETGACSSIRPFCLCIRRSNVHGLILLGPSLRDVVASGARAATWSAPAFPRLYRPFAVAHEARCLRR